jgi:opacity protein-like surface antigen
MKSSQSAQTQPTISPTSTRSRRLPLVRRAFGSALAVTMMAAAHAATVSAQDEPKPPIGSFGVSVIQTRPIGALGSNIESGYGLFGTFLLPLDGSGMLSLRADVGASEYGSDARRTAFSETVGGRVELDVRTTNIVAPASVGLQLGLPVGPIRPYVNAGGGVLLFYTESSVEPAVGGFALASSVNQSDVAFGWMGGGGVYVPLAWGAHGAMLDLGVQYVHGGNADYLAPGSIADLPGGAITISPMESSTHLMTLRVGVRFGR